MPIAGVRVRPGLRGSVSRAVARRAGHRGRDRRLQYTSASSSNRLLSKPVGSGGVAAYILLCWSCLSGGLPGSQKWSIEAIHKKKLEKGTNPRRKLLEGNKRSFAYFLISKTR